MKSFMAAILGCFILFHIGVQAQEVPSELLNDVNDVNVTDEVNENQAAVNTTSELKPKKCNQILQDVVDQSINNVSSYFLNIPCTLYKLKGCDFRPVP